MKSEEYIETMIVAKEDFDREIMPATRKALKALIVEADPEYVRECRTEYLKEKMSEAIINAWHWMAMHEEDVRKDLPSINRLFWANKIRKYVKEISGLQGAIIAMRKPERKGQITDEMIQKAREYPFEDLLEFRKNKTNCPFHEDRTPSAHLYGDNHIYCFSCHKNIDTIDFIMERDGKTFADAVKYLQ
jgi:hypothetical protein